VKKKTKKHTFQPQQGRDRGQKGETVALASEKVQKVGICLARPYKGWLASKDLPNRRQSWIKWVVSGKDWLLCKITRDKGEFAIYSAI